MRTTVLILLLSAVLSSAVAIDNADLLDLLKTLRAMDSEEGDGTENKLPSTSEETGGDETGGDETGGDETSEEEERPIYAIYRPWANENWSDKKCESEPIRDDNYNPNREILSELPLPTQCGVGEGTDGDGDGDGDIIEQILSWLHVEIQLQLSFKRSEKRVVGGEESSPGQWPWLVGVGLKDVGLFCGGSLISEDWVLTTAVCFADVHDPSYPLHDMVHPCDYNVRVAAFDLSAEDDGHMDIPAKEIFVHPGFDSATWDNNIALIKLSKKVPMKGNDRVAAICLPTEEDDFYPGRECFFAGWGSSTATVGGNFTDVTMTDTVHDVEVAITDWQQCHDTLAQLVPGIPVTEGMMCAGREEGGKDACMGDSGGPLVCKDDNGVFVQAGLAAWGYGCAEPGVPAVYTNLQPYMHWVESVLDRFG